MASPDIAIVIPTYQQAHHLRRVLTSVAAQQDLAPRQMEVVVADDGSADETPAVVAQFAQSARFPLRFTTHPHDGFQLARCRNEGASASTAEYLLFLDGDCLIPPNHVVRHLEARMPGTVMAGYCCRLDEPTTMRINEATIRSGEYLRWIPETELRYLAKMDRKSRFYNFIHHPTKPRMFGGNIGVWRADYQRVNGFDECFRAWGGEDDDLRLRLRRVGVQIQSVLRWTRTYHLWHSPDISAPKRLREGANIPYLHREIRLTCCANGMVKRRPADLDIRFVGRTSHLDAVTHLLPPSLCRPAPDRLSSDSTTPADVEILVLPGSGCFSGRADCNILIALDDSAAAGKLARQAHLVLSDHPCPNVYPHRQLALHEFDRAFERILGSDLAQQHQQDLEHAA